MGQREMIPRCYWTGLGEQERVKEEQGSLIAPGVMQLETFQLTFIDKTYSVHDVELPVTT